MRPSGISAKNDGSVVYAETVQRIQPQGMIHATEIKRIEMPVYDSNEQKPFEYISSITDTSSSSYKLLHSKGVRYEQDGTIRIADYIAAAMGQSYGQVGDRFQVELSTGKWLSVVIADSKRNCDTKGGQGYTGKNGHTLEMIVWSVPASARGSKCYGGIAPYKGTIIRILKEK